jgi:hypothetical protein
LFVVSAGANTFYLLGQKTSAASVNAAAFDSQLTLVYFPTAYGTVVGTLQNLASERDDGSNGAPDRERGASIRQALTVEAVATEQAESIAANQARLERELAGMRARFDALQEELEQNMRAQQAVAREARGAKPIRPITEGDE